MTTVALPRTSFANSEVLAFYRELPFNCPAGAAEFAAAIRARDPLGAYPPLRALLGPTISVLDAGCGAGWLANAIAFHHRAEVTGLDFNPVAIERAQEVARILGSPAAFEREDLFLYEPPRPFDVVVSIGVLHHTDNCEEATRRLGERCVRPGGHYFLGLYHRFGRRPFLEHFAALRADGATREALRAEYCRLHRSLLDPTHAESWFRDQVLHPHETQHTLAELKTWLEPLGFELIATSLNQFGPLTGSRGELDEILAAEPALEARGRELLARGEYYPGFFLALLRRLPEQIP